MTTLLDAPEFAAAKDALSMTLERIEKARQDRLKFLQDALSRTETELDRVKKQALEFPTHIARYRAEIRPDVPPPSEWCDGSGKGGVE